MPTDYVVDASAIGRLVYEHADTPQFQAWLDTRKRGRSRFFAPDLLPHELASIVQRVYGGGSHGGDTEFLRRTVTAALQGIALDDTAWARTWTLAGSLSHYDATYVALALAKGATLVTFDKRTAAEARKHLPVIGVDGLD